MSTADNCILSGFPPHVGNNVLIVAHASSLEACTRQLQGRSPLSSRDFIQVVRKVSSFITLWLLVAVCESGQTADVLLSSNLYLSFGLAPDSIPGLLFLSGAGGYGGVAVSGPSHPPPHTRTKPQLFLEGNASAGMTSVWSKTKIRLSPLTWYH